MLRYMEECEWRHLLQYGERRAREEGVGLEDVADLVEEYRARGWRPAPSMRVVLDTNVMVMFPLTNVRF